MLQKTLLLCSCLTGCFGFAQPTQQKSDSLKNVLLQHTARDTNRVVTLIRYAGVLFYLQPDSSLMNYANEALQIAEQINWKEGIARSFQLKAVVYNTFWNDPIRALDCYQKALSSNYSNANKGFEWTTLMNIGVIHFNLSENEQALHYFNQAYAIVQQQADKKNEDQLLVNMGNAYYKLNQNAEAEEFFTKGIALAEKGDNVQVIANALCSRGLLYQTQKKLNLAKEDLEKGVALAKKYNFIGFRVAGLLNLAETFTDLKNYPTAEKYAQEALQLSRQTHMQQLEVQTLGTLADVYNANGNANKALAYYKQYQPMHDSLLSDETKLSLTRLEMQYQFKQKEDSAKIAYEKQQSLAAEKLQQQRIVNSSLMGGTGVLLLAGFTSFIFYKRRRDAESQKQKAELLTEVANTELKALRAQINPHFIFNSLDSIADFVVKNNTQTADHFLTKFSKMMRHTLENSGKKEISLAKDLDALERYIQLEAMRLQNKFTYEIKVDEAIDKETTLISPLILQPFVENSIKHGITPKEGKGKIVIAFKREGQMICCSVEDDGIGRKAAEAIKTETEHIARKSFGMEITKERIEILNKLKKAYGVVKIFDLEKGTRVELQLPLELKF